MKKTNTIIQNNLPRFKLCCFLHTINRIKIMTKRDFLLSLSKDELVELIFGFSETNQEACDFIQKKYKTTNSLYISLQINKWLRSCLDVVISQISWRIKWLNLSQFICKCGFFSFKIRKKLFSAYPGIFFSFFPKFCRCSFYYRMNFYRADDFHIWSCWIYQDFIDSPFCNLPAVFILFCPL